jgi:hypothetical protein
MHPRRSQGDSKSTSSISGSLSSMPITNTNNPSSTSTTGRVSIYSMRERVILNKMTKIMGKLAPDTETEVTSRLHQEIPAIRLDGHLTYCLYNTLQNLVHLNSIYILLYHAMFWLDTSNSHKEIYRSTRLLDQNQYEQTHLLTISNDYYYYSIARKAINIDLIDKYIYMSLIGISSIELISTFLWTLRKKLPYFIQRNQKLKHRLSKLLIGMIIIIYFSFITWLVFHTFFTHQLSSTFFFLIFSHLILITFLDKPNLFQESPYNFSKQSTIARKQYRNSTSSSSTSSMSTTALSRLSYRSSTSTQPRKINPIINPSSPSTTTLIPWSRWFSITEEKLEVHECSTFYAQARQEADDLWPSVVRRIILNIYRTVSSFILFDLIPIKMMSMNFFLSPNDFSLFAYLRYSCTFDRYSTNKIINCYINIKYFRNS